MAAVKPMVSDSFLALHWNGTSWTKTTTPSPGGDSGFTLLSGVTAISPANAWAVGYSATSLSSGTGQPLVLHWNGTSWKKVAVPAPGGTTGVTDLVGLSAVSASSIWATGYYATSPGGGSGQSLTCTGTARTGSRSPAPARAARPA
jgi:hypothetical protein